MTWSLISAQSGSTGTTDYLWVSKLPHFGAVATGGCLLPWRAFSILQVLETIAAPVSSSIAVSGIATSSSDLPSALTPNSSSTMAAQKFQEKAVRKVKTR